MSENRLAAKLTKVDKAAILLLSLGETDAAQVLRHMGPKEVQRVGVAMASMRNVPVSYTHLTLPTILRV